MILEHAGKRPKIDATAVIAVDATVSGDVTISADARILYGARIIGEAGGQIRIGRGCIVRENAVIRATPRHACIIGDACLVGPNAHIVGATLEDEVFIATGVSVFHGALLGRGAEIRPHAIVHLRTHLASGAMVPIGWVAVGDPAQLFSPDRHQEIWAVQEPLNFPEWVYGVPRDSPQMMRQVTRGLSESLGVLASDRIVCGERDLAR